jgi:hypothetical protein
MARSLRIGPINVCRGVHEENTRNRLALWVIRLAEIRRGARYYADCDPLDHQLLSPATGPTVLPKNTVTTSIHDLHNPTRSAPAMCISRGPLNHRDLNGDIGSDPADPASAAGFHGTIGETVVINPALAISGIKPINQCYYNPAYYLIVSDCANTNIGVWSENSLDRTVVGAVWGQPNRFHNSTKPALSCRLSPPHRDDACRCGRIRPCRFRAKESVLADAVERPLAQEDPHVVREREGLVQSSVDRFHQFSLPTEIKASRHVEMSNGHVMLLLHRVSELVN